MEIDRSIALYVRQQREREEEKEGMGLLLEACVHVIEEINRQGGDVS